jgi:3'-phosphoadenosine 5'-phosphosulfate (PAPS) 3'-phosphatase
VIGRHQFDSNSAAPLTELLLYSHDAIKDISQLVRGLYQYQSTLPSQLTKADNSVVTCADGIVQCLLADHLFRGLFRDIVGEEEGSIVNITSRPYNIILDQGNQSSVCAIPETVWDQIDDVKARCQELKGTVPPHLFKKITVFIDPIDGTKEFASGQGEQSTICVGFVEHEHNLPVAGIVCRPITGEWVAGCKGENYNAGELDPNIAGCKGFLSSNGSISPFLAELTAELGLHRVKAGGVGNKMMMLLEGKGQCYIQDRGVSRWDTCAAQAILEARGGFLCKLASFEHGRALESYQYKRTNRNMDYDGDANHHTTMTAYNAVDKSNLAVRPCKQGFLPYSNLLGLFAVHAGANQEAELKRYFDAMQRAKAKHTVGYD